MYNRILIEKVEIHTRIVDITDTRTTLREKQYSPANNIVVVVHTYELEERENVMVIARKKTKTRVRKRSRRRFFRASVMTTRQSLCSRSSFVNLK